ncbi:hypothetical protein GCM10009734_44460 [Nonomuraea bangladeshensis]
MVESGPVLVGVDLGDIIEMDHESITACQSRGQDGSEGGTCPLPATGHSAAVALPMIDVPIGQTTV